MSRPNPNEFTHRLKAQRTHAFTLLEVTLAMALMVILIVGIFEIINASISAMSELQAREARQQKINGLVNLCQQTLRSLPASAVFEGRIRQDGEAYLREIVIRNAPTAFAWGPSGGTTGATVLGAQVQPGGLVSLTLGREEEDPEATKHISDSDQERPKLILISDIRKLQWRYFDNRSHTWLEEWKDTSAKPSMVELVFQFGGEDRNTRAIFRLPTITKDAS